MFGLGYPTNPNFGANYFCGVDFGMFGLKKQILYYSNMEDFEIDNNDELIPDIFTQKKDPVILFFVIAYLPTLQKHVTS